jgi:hypothetical protein
MGVLNISTYRVGTNRSRTNTNAHGRYLSLAGNAESGPANQAIIYFWPTQPNDTVGYVAGNLVVGLLNERDFDAMYDILRNEKPAKLTYIENSSASESRLWHIGIGTLEEGVGEGPEDPS